MVTLAVAGKNGYLLCTIEHNGSDLATLSKERLQLLVVEKAIGRDVLQLKDMTRRWREGAESHAAAAQRRPGPAAS